VAADAPRAEIPCRAGIRRRQARAVEVATRRRSAYRRLTDPAHGQVVGDRRGRSRDRRGRKIKIGALASWPGGSREKSLTTCRTVCRGWGTRSAPDVLRVCTTMCPSRCTLVADPRRRCNRVVRPRVAEVDHVRPSARWQCLEPVGCRHDGRTWQPAGVDQINAHPRPAIRQRSENAGYRSRRPAAEGYDCSAATKPASERGTSDARAAADQHHTAAPASLPQVQLVVGAQHRGENQRTGPPKNARPWQVRFSNPARENVVDLMIGWAAAPRVLAWASALSLLKFLCALCAPIPRIGRSLLFLLSRVWGGAE